MKTEVLVPPRRAKDKLITVILGLFAAALLVGIRDPDSTPLLPALPAGQRKPLSDFTFQTLNGTPWTLSGHRGHVVLLNFWATWCPPCQSETPSLVRIANADHARGLDVAGIAMDQRSQDSRKNIQSFAAAYHVSYPILLPNASSPIINGIAAYPTTYLIDRKGRVANAYTGALDEAALRPEIERLLEEPSGAAK